MNENDKNEREMKMISAVAHRLRTPLTVIMSTVNNFLDGAFGSLNDEQKKWIKKLETHTATLEGLLNEILAVLRRTPGVDPFAKSSVSEKSSAVPETVGAPPALTTHAFKILIVDDEPDLLETIQEGLLMKGFKTLTASDGETAVRLTLEEKPDLILMDVLLKSQNGMDVCRTIKSKTKTFIPIILMTGQDDLREKVSGIKNESDDLLSKPFQIEELYSRVRSMLRLKSLNDELALLKQEAKRKAA